MTEEDNNQLLAQLLKQRKEGDFMSNSEGSDATEAMLQRRARELGIIPLSDTKATDRLKEELQSAFSATPESYEPLTSDEVIFRITNDTLSDQE